MKAVHVSAELLRSTAMVMVRSLCTCVALLVLVVPGLDARAPVRTTAHAPPRPTPRPTQISVDVLRDKIRGGWAGQTIGVTFGGPTEFKFKGTLIQDYVPLAWYPGYLKQTYERSPGLYDDIYVDLTFVDVIEKHGLDAPASAFADALAHSGYQLWHANQTARYNILRGLSAPASGNWRNNPDADDLDFQIESDFIGLMSPGMPNAATALADRVGHVMNSGDGWYGGVFISAMYSLAFVSSDVKYVVREGLKTIPARTRFHDTIADVIRLHQRYPNDWKRAWFEIEKRWTEDVGCPDGVFTAFDIDATLNSAYVALALLYGAGDMTKTLSIATRAGQDSDCNPSSAGGILGTMLGYAKIPAYWKQGLAEVESIDFSHTTISLNDVYDLSLKHALANIVRNGGQVADGQATLPVQRPVPVRREQNFEGHFPTAEILFDRPVRDELTFEFTGIGFALQGAARSDDGKDQELNGELWIDGKLVASVVLPTAFRTRRYVPFYRYELADGKHTVKIVLREPSKTRYLQANRAIVYGSAPVKPRV